MHSSDTDSTSTTDSSAHQPPAGSRNASNGGYEPGPLVRVASHLSPGVVATGVATFAAILIIAGLLWTGTGLNNGIEAPSVVAIPTPWFAALVGAGVLAVIISFLGFWFAYAEDDDGGTDDRPAPAPSQNEVGSGGETAAPTSNGADGPTVVGRGGGHSGQGGPSDPSDPAVQRRVEDNYPDRLSQGTEQGTGRNGINRAEAPQTNTESDNRQRQNQSRSSQPDKNDSGRSSGENGCESHGENPERNDTPSNGSNGGEVSRNSRQSNRSESQSSSKSVVVRKDYQNS